VAYVWHASKFTREVLDGLLRIGFLPKVTLAMWMTIAQTKGWYADDPTVYEPDDRIRELKRRIHK
jgi:hypothetical protein